MATKGPVVSFIRKQQIYHRISINTDVTGNYFTCLPEKLYIKHTNQIEQMFYKIGILKISATYQENTCVKLSFLINLQAFSLQLYLKKESSTGVFL